MPKTKKFLWIALIVLSSTFTTESMFSDCKSPWVSVGTGCYSFESLLQSIKQYSDAIELCPPYSHPLHISSEEELEILSRIIKVRLKPRIPFTGIWTSGTRTLNMEDYFWNISALEKKKVGYFAWLNEDTLLQNRNNHLALAFNATTDLLGYTDVDSEYPTGLGVVCKGTVCHPPICRNDTKCVPFVDSNGCTVCSECIGQGCKVQLDVEADGSTVCMTCYCKKGCDDVAKCQHGCRLVARDDGCPKCECPAVIVPLDVQLKFTHIVPNAGNLICLTVNKLIRVSEICTKRVVVRCRATANLEDQDDDVTVTVGIVTLSIRTTYTNFISVLHECKYFLENNILNKIGAHVVESVHIEVPNYMPTPPTVTQSTCLKQKGNLPCDDNNKFYELRWEFDTRIGYCRPYIHNGCQDDKVNSFPTLLECRSVCSEARCFLPRNPGNCEVYGERWAYDPYTGLCELLRACENGNSNSFLTENECNSACQGVVCAEPVDVGPCHSKSVATRYHYDVVTNKCNAFNWGGCFGNGNRFQSHSSCEEKCRAIPANVQEKTTTVGKATSAVPRSLATTRHMDRGQYSYQLGITLWQNRTPERPCTCRLDGDPRVTTFDGAALLVNGVGFYVLLKTEFPELGQRFLLAVETAQAAPGQYPGLLRIVRIYFKAQSQLTVVEHNSIQIDNRPVTVLPSRNGDVTVSGVIGDHVRISHSIGYDVSAKFGRTAQDTHVVCSTTIDVALQSPVGLCGNCDGNAADEFVVDSADLSRDPDRFQKISRAHLRDLAFILSS